MMYLSRTPLPNQPSSLVKRRSVCPSTTLTILGGVERPFALRALTGLPSLMWYVEQPLT